MKNDIKIKEDSVSVAVFVNATIVEFDQPYDKEYFELRYKGKDKLILVAYVKNQPAGYMISYDKNLDGSIYCWMVGVDPRFRRLGILTELMQYLLKWAKENNYKKIQIKTRNNRRGMLTYLIKNNFNVIGFLPQPQISDNQILFEKNIK